MVFFFFADDTKLFEKLIVGIDNLLKLQTDRLCNNNTTFLSIDKYYMCLHFIF